MQSKDTSPIHPIDQQIPYQEILKFRVIDAVFSFKPNYKDIIPIPNREGLKNALQLEVKKQNAELNLQLNRGEITQEVFNMQSKVVLFKRCKDRAQEIENIATEFLQNKDHFLMNKLSVELLKNFINLENKLQQDIAIYLEQIAILLKIAINDVKITEKAKNTLIIKISVYLDVIACVDGSMERLEKIIQVISSCKILGTMENFYKLKESWLLAYCCMLTLESSQRDLEERKLLKALNLNTDPHMQVHAVNSLVSSASRYFATPSIAKTRFMKDFDANQENMLGDLLQRKFNMAFISLIADNIESIIIDQKSNFMSVEGCTKEDAEKKVCDNISAILAEYGINYPTIYLDTLNGQKKAEGAEINDHNTAFIIKCDENYNRSFVSDLNKALRAVVAHSPLIEQYIQGTKKYIQAPVENGKKNEKYLEYEILNTGEEIFIYVNEQIHILFSHKDIMQLKQTQHEDIFMQQALNDIIYDLFNAITTCNIQIKSTNTKAEVEKILFTHTDKILSERQSSKKIMNIYWENQGLCKKYIEQILAFSQNNISILISDNAFKIYRLDIEPILLEKILCGRGINTVKLLISDNALTCYNARYCSFDDIKDLNDSRIITLTSKDMIACYMMKAFSFNDIKDLEDSQIIALTSEGIQKCYKAGYCNISSFFYYIEMYFPSISERKLVKHSLRSGEISALTSNKAYECYKNGYFTFNDLTNDTKHLDSKRIKYLTTAPNILECYAEKYCSLNDLNPLSKEQIQALTSWNAIACYENGYCTFNDLKNLSIERIKILTSDDVYECYKKYCTFHDLKNLSIEEINALTNKGTQRCYDKHFSFDDYTFHEIRDLNIKRINALTNSRKKCYYRHFSFHDIVGLDPNIIYILASINAQECYNKTYSSENNYDKPYCTADDLIKVGNTAKMKILISDNAQECYKKGYLQFKDLKDLSIEKIEILISPAAQKFYTIKTIRRSESIGYYTIEDLQYLDIERIKALISDNAQQCYKKGYCTLDDLVDFPIDKINALTSINTQKCYEKDCNGKSYCTFNDLQTLDTDKINALTSINTQKCYEKDCNGKSYCTFNDLQKLDVKEIKAFISYYPFAYYKYCTFEDLQMLDPVKRRALTCNTIFLLYSRHSPWCTFNIMCEVYDKQPEFFSMFVKSLRNSGTNCDEMVKNALSYKSNVEKVMQNALQKNIQEISFDMMQAKFYNIHDLIRFGDYDWNKYVNFYAKKTCELIIQSSGVDIEPNLLYEIAQEETVKKVFDKLFKFLHLVIKEASILIIQKATEAKKHVYAYMNEDINEEKSWSNRIKKQNISPKEQSIHKEIQKCVYDVVINTIGTIIKYPNTSENTIKQCEIFRKIALSAEKNITQGIQEQSGINKSVRSK